MSKPFSFYEFDADQCRDRLPWIIVFRVGCLFSHLQWRLLDAPMTPANEDGLLDDITPPQPSNSEIH